MDSRHSETVATLRLDLARRGAVEFTGAAPKAVAMLTSESEGSTAPIRCRFIVDV